MRFYINPKYYLKYFSAVLFVLIAKLTVAAPSEIHITFNRNITSEIEQFSSNNPSRFKLEHVRLETLSRYHGFVENDYVAGYSGSSSVANTPVPQSDGYYNKVLNGTRQAPEDFAYHYQNLANGLEDDIPKYSGVSYRASMTPGFNQGLIHEGDIISNKAFLSTSTSKDYAQYWASGIVNKSQKPTFYIVEGKTGYASLGQNEAEVVFKPNRKFKVLSIKQLQVSADNYKNVDSNVVYLEEVPDENIQASLIKDEYTGMAFTPHPITTDQCP